MHQFLSLSIALGLIFPTQAFAQTGAQRPCNAETTLSRVQTAVNKFMCMNLFYNGQRPVTAATDAGRFQNDNFDRYTANTKCGMLLLGGTAAIAVGGLTGSYAAQGLSREGETRRNLARAGDESRALNHRLREVEAGLRGGSEYDRAVARGQSSEIYRMLSANHNTQMAYYDRLSKIHTRTMRFIGPTSFRAMGALAASGIFMVGSAILDASPAGCSEVIHMYTDFGPNCEYLPVLGTNTRRFLDMPIAEQNRIMAQDTRMCEKYTELADKLESDLSLTNPRPDFTVTSCSPAGEVTGVNLGFASGPYPNGGGTFNITTPRAGSLNIDLPGPETDYELDLNANGFGVDSISRLRAKVRGGQGITRSFTSTQLLAEAPSKADRRQYLERSLRALHGFEAVKKAVGTNCAQYLAQQEAPAAGEADVDQ